MAEQEFDTSSWNIIIIAVLLVCSAWVCWSPPGDHGLLWLLVT